MSLVMIVRHAHKAADGSLTPEGRAAALQRGKALGDRYSGRRIVANSSDAGRARETAELIMQGAGADYDSRDTIDQRLSLGYTAEEVNAIKASGESSLYRKAEAAVPGTTRIRGEQIEDFVLERIAEDADDSTVYVGVTHSPNVEAYCRRLSDDERVKDEPAPLQGVAVSGEDGEADIEYAHLTVKLGYCRARQPSEAEKDSAQQKEANQES